MDEKDIEKENEVDDNDEKEKISIIEIIAWASIGIGFIILTIDYVIASTGQCTPWTILGQKGDFGGGHLTGFFTLAGFFLMYRAIGLQREDIKIQRDELIKSREVFEEQKNIQIKQLENNKKNADREHLISLAALIHNLFSSVIIHDKGLQNSVSIYENLLENFVSYYNAYNRTYNIKIPALAKSVLIKGYFQSNRISPSNIKPEVKDFISEYNSELI
jgi:hypothetical protein